MTIHENLLQIKKELPPQVKLLAVSKTKSPEEILEVYNAGHKIFGENKVQELTSKFEILPKDIEWHMIGHLQTNKVKYIAPFIHLIHSVDSLNLLKEINKQAQKNNRIINCLLQIYIATEETKFGLNDLELQELLANEEYKKLENIKIVGLMGMASFTPEVSLIKSEFKKLFDIFVKTKQEYFSTDAEFKEISMGMSSDYPIAIEQGSTIVRIGSKLFGERNYIDKN